MGEARRRHEARQIDDIDTTGVIIDGWQAYKGLAVTRDEAACPPVWINPDRIAHMQALHPAGSAGLVTLMRVHLTKDKGWRWKSLAVSPNALATCPDLQLATHATINTFYGLRRARGLRCAKALMADVDYHTVEGHKHRPPEEMMWILRQRLAEAGIPEPSYWMHSGRGILLIWLFHDMPRGAEPRVRAVQKALLGPKQGKAKAGRREPDEREARNAVRMSAIWQGTGLDRSACDVARVFRIAGSRNEKSEQRVRLLHPASWSEVKRYDFEELADAILPYTRDEIAAFRAERQAQRAGIEALRQDREDRLADQVEDTAPRIPNTGRRDHRFAGGQWQRRVDALFAIRSHWGGTPPKGARELWAYHLACAYACLEKGDLASWAREIGPLAGVPVDDLRVSLGTVYRKMCEFQRGEMSTWNGQPCDPRYTPSHAEVISELGLTAEDLAAAGIEYMLSGQGARSATERSKERRLRDGHEPRTVTVDRRHADGLAAHAMKAAGKTMAEISAVLKRGLTSLRRAMAETVDKIGQAVEAAAETASEVIADVVSPPSRRSLANTPHHGSARYLVAMPVNRVTVLAAGLVTRLSGLPRSPDRARPMPAAPPTMPFRPVVPVARPRPAPASWAARSLSAMPSQVARTSVVPRLAPSRLSALRPSLALQEPSEVPAPVSAPVTREAVAEPRRAPAGQSMAEMVMSAFPGAFIVGERPSRQAA